MISYHGIVLQEARFKVTTTNSLSQSCKDEIQPFLHLFIALDGVWQALHVGSEPIHRRIRRICILDILRYLDVRRRRSISVHDWAELNITSNAHATAATAEVVRFRVSIHGI